MWSCNKKPVVPGRDVSAFSTEQLVEIMNRFVSLHRLSGAWAFVREEDYACIQVTLLRQCRKKSKACQRALKAEFDLDAYSAERKIVIDWVWESPPKWITDQ